MLETILFYAAPFFSAVVISAFLTPIIKRDATAAGLVDVQNEASRKKHPKSAVPYLGGWAVILAMVMTIGFAFVYGFLADSKIQPEHIAVILGSLVLLGFHGYLDDKLQLKPLPSLVIPGIVAALTVWGGISIGYVTNPFEAGTGPFGLSLLYFGTTIGATVSFLWIMGMMYTVKLLDGLDGLVTGIGLIGAVILFIVSLFWDVSLSGTSVLAVILAGSLLGFLPYNWHPAKIFLGESSVAIGYMLAVLSIISGGKVATALLIMGIPILDVVWAMIYRMVVLKRSPFKGDRKHLHFRLIDGGVPHRKAVLFLYLITALFGTASIFLQSRGKVAALVVLLCVMAALVVWLSKLEKK